MKHILFLGGNGFLGKNVLQYYRDCCAAQENIHFVIVGRSVNNPQNLPANVICHVFDFSDRQQLENLFRQYPFSEVFHFISATIPANSNDNISNDIEVNLLGSIALLELMVKYNVNKIVYISSGGAVYGDSVSGGSMEEDFNNPNNSYGIIKLTIEKYIALFHKLYGLEYLTLRLSNPFGPYHTNTKNGIINIALRKAILEEPVVVWGDGLNTKDYIYVKDFARMFWDLYFGDVKNKILNVGSGRVYSVLELLQNIKKVVPGLRWRFEPAKTFDTRKVEFKLASLKKILNIENTDFLTALQETYDWEYAQARAPKP